MTYLRIEADGNVTKHDGTPSLEDMQAAVGGYVEAHSLVLGGDDYAYLLVNEDGRRMGLAANAKATRLAREFGNVGAATIVGSVILAGPADDDGEFTSLSDVWVDLLTGPVTEEAEA